MEKTVLQDLRKVAQESDGIQAPVILGIFDRVRNLATCAERVLQLLVERDINLTSTYQYQDLREALIEVDGIEGEQENESKPFVGDDDHEKHGWGASDEKDSELDEDDSKLDNVGGFQDSGIGANPQLEEVADDEYDADEEAEYESEDDDCDDNESEEWEAEEEYVVESQARPNPAILEEEAEDDDEW